MCPLRGPGIITDWIEQEGHVLKFTRFHEKDALPDHDAVDMLIIMGGPMNVFDDHPQSRMREEIDWVASFINTGKAVLGICLGAQIIATALGSEVYQGKEKEIGWYDIRFLPGFGTYRICKTLPSSRKVFHWHGDTFRIPKGATRIAESKLFPNQGFIYEKRVIALQFHLEVRPADVADLIENCRDELLRGPNIMPEKELLDKGRFRDENRLLLFRILDYLAHDTLFQSRQ